jgi:[protein-PII] uridylyltransferase
MTSDGAPASLPDLSRVRAELAATAAMPRAEAVQANRSLRQRELSAIAEFQRSRLADISGAAIVEAITVLTDEIVRTLVARAFAKLGAPANWSEQVGIFALGGYGRREMNPGSDLDLLVMAVGNKPPDWLAKAYPDLQALLWDVKFTVGASQRSAAELSRIIDEDFVTATAVIEQRPVVAGSKPVSEMQDLLARFRRRQALPFLRYKLEELAKRRAQAGVSLFLMEPNLKSNPGCLRDVQLLRTFAYVAFGSRDLSGLLGLEVITQRDLDEVDAANDHLMRLRSLQHFHHQRKQDIFQLPDQVRVAKLLGWADLSSLRAVEHFMKAHYAQVLHVHQMVDLAVSRLRALGHLGRKPILILSRKVLSPDFSAVQGQVYLSHKDFWTLPDAGARLLRMCRLAQCRDVRISLELQRGIKEHLALITDEVRNDRALGRLFLEMLGDAGRIHPILEDMHNCGLLGAYMPEFGNLTCHMQFDSYHQYTVDQHTLLAISYIDAVAAEKMPGLPGMAAIFPAVKRKDLLALGLLLHDMGKYMGRGHVARGAIMVSAVAQRFGLDEDEADFVYFLVERHVSLSDASRMRNFHEPSFLREFALKIDTQENLDALYCLTYFDAKAVGEGILTGWQEAILGELHQALSEQLGKPGTHAHVSKHERLVRELTDGGVAPAEAEAFIGEFPGTYVHQVRPGELSKHLRVLTEAKRDGIGLIHELADKFVHVTAAVPDRHGLFADVAATLSGHGFDIIDARTWVSRHGMVIYSYRLSSIYPARVKEEPSWKRLRADLLAVSRGTIDANALLDKRRNALVIKPADSGFDDPAVKVEQRTSESHTIVDIHTRDEVGLLSKLCRGISEYGCDIGFACINTMGDVAVDVFYVDRAGAKLDDADAEGLRQHIIRTLNLTPAAG